MPQPSGQPSEIPYDRGTIEQHNLQLLSAHLRHSIVAGEITVSDFADWLAKPWTAIRFLEGRVSPKKEIYDALPSAPTDPPPLPFVAPDVLNTLREWAKAADQSESDRVNWEKNHPAEKQKATETIVQLHSALAPSVETLERTGESLNVTKGLNAVENVLRGTKEYVWDELWDHPEMSAGLVILAYFAYRKLKGTPLGTLILTAGGVTVAGAFLKSKFGAEPTEKLAEIAERVGLKEVADGIRTTRDTITRGLFGAEGEGTINGYFYEKLGFHRKLREQVAFNFLLYQNPKKFIEWYDAARGWKQPTTGKKPYVRNVPPPVRNLVSEMSRGKTVPPSFKSLPIEERTEILLDVADRVLKHVAESNGKNTVDDGLAILQQKYIDGSYFNLLWDRFDAFSADLRTKYTHPEIVKQIDRIRDSYKDFYTGMARRVQHGSDVIQFMDILIIETSDAEFEKIRKYQGPGLTIDKIGSALEDVRKKIVELGGDAAEKGLEAFDALVNYATVTVPGALKSEWEELWPVLKPYFEAGSDKAMEVYDWFFVDKVGERVIMMTDGTTEYESLSRFEEAMEKARVARESTVHFVVDSRLAGLLKELGIQAVGAIEITLEEAEKLAEWLKERNQLSASARSFAAQWDDGASEISMRIPNAVPGYQYDIEISVLISHPSAGNSTQVNALPTRTATSANPLAISKALPALPPGSKAIQAECRLTVTSPGGNKSEARRQITFP